MKKVVVGLSGGVDSSVAAALLLKQGYDVTGVYIEAYNEPGCRTDQDKQDALKVALQLGIHFVVLDLRKEYKAKVIKYFYTAYQAGLTPNPDVVCNREIKFGIFLDWAVAQGFDYVATGHYARISGGLLQRAKDQHKDQSYFLWQVTPEKLQRVMFPLGDLTKIGVRQKARAMGLPTASKPDSMGICFVGEVNVAKMLRAKLGVREGEVVFMGKVVGKHQGLWTVTVGERVGSEVKLSPALLRAIGVDTAHMSALYVIDKDKKRNMVIVGKREECQQTEFGIREQVGLIPEKELQVLIKRRRLFVRIRNLGELTTVSLCHCVTNGRWEIETAEPVFAPAEGQMAVLYARQGIEGDEVVVAGGEIG